MVLIDWYIIPVMIGMNMTSDYLQNQSDNHILDIIGFNQDDIVNEKVGEFENAMNNGDDLEKSLDKIMTDIYVIQEDGLKQMYSIILYQFSPLVTMFAVWYFHIRIWSWVARKICKVLKLSNTLEKTIEVDGQ